MNRQPHPTASAAVLALTGLALGGLAACSDVTAAPGSRAMTLSFATTPAGAPGISASLAGAADALVITKAQLVLSRTELEMVNGNCASNDDEGDDDGCAELKLGPMLVDLPLTSGAKTALTVAVPAGRYDKIEAKIDAVASESDGHHQDAATFLAAHPEFRNISIRVEGTFNGQPFVYTTALDAEMEMEFNPPLVVDGAAGNLTVQVDLSTWFLGRDGAAINPATANAGGVNRSLVEDNIKRSFKVFEDDDHDGRHDDHDD